MPAPQLHKSECTHIFITGLRPDIRSHLVLQQPQSFEDAEQQAMLKEAVAIPHAATTASEQLAQALLTHVTSHPSPPSQPVAAFTASYSKDSREDEHVTASTLRSPIQQFRDAIKDFTTSARRDDFRPRGNRTNDRANHQPRNRRTPDGSPICNTFNGRGHMSYNCTTLSCNFRRDPRIPNARRPAVPNRRPPQFPSGNM